MTPFLAALAVAPFALAQNPLPPTPPSPQNPRGPQTPRRPVPGTPKGPVDPSGGPGQNPGLGGGGQGRGAAPRPGGPRPYDEVVTKEAKSDPGVFTLHRVGDQLLFEIPKAGLDREMLLAMEVSGSPAGAGGYGGATLPNAHRVVRWTRRGNTILLRVPDYSSRAEGTGALARAVQSANVEPIAATFDVLAEGKEGSVVIDVTRFFTSDPQDFSIRGLVGGGAPDPARSYIERSKSFPTNVEITSTLTFVGGAGTLSFGPSGLVQRGGGTATALVHYSLVNLPEKPMMPREFDSRVGYFTEDFTLYGDPRNQSVEKSYIARYRLEKKDPSAALSEPVKPIVYYISREVPEWLHPYMKKAVEDWNVAFEQAGFKNAIQCKEAPDDPNWDPEDVRYSVIRWAPTPTENAMGPHISDPRTGEILSAHIIVWHDIMKLGQTWYFTQVGDLDPRASKLPLPQDLLGRIMQYVVSHEVGHTLGLRHNHKASSAYTVAQLRDKAFTDQYGDEASIMDYGRFNYVAQPGDNANLVPIIGPYDKFAIQWGYETIPNAKKPADEKRELDRLASKGATDPMLRFGGEDAAAGADPTVQTEDLGSDPIEATRYGLMNIDRIARMLIPATTVPGEDYDELGEVYAALLAQRNRELLHVAKLVGGVVETRYHVGYGGAPPFAPVPAARQAAAVDFLVKNGLTTPKSLIIPDILYRVGPNGAQAQVLGGQRAILNSLMSPDKVARLQDAAAIDPTAYTIGRLVHDVQSGVWSELMTPSPKVDPYRRGLQRAYLEFAQARLQAEDASATPSDLRAVLTGNLRELKATLGRAIAKTTDETTRMHELDAQTTIERILDPNAVVVQSAAPAAPPTGRRGR